VRAGRDPNAELGAVGDHHGRRPAIDAGLPAAHERLTHDQEPRSRERGGEAPPVRRPADLLEAAAAERDRAARALDHGVGCRLEPIGGERSRGRRDPFAR